MTEAGAPPLPAPVHPHGRSCYWDLLECRWSCESPRRAAAQVPSGTSATAQVVSPR